MPGYASNAKAPKRMFVPAIQPDRQHKILRELPELLCELGGLHHLFSKIEGVRLNH